MDKSTNRFPLIMDDSWLMKALDYTQKYLARCFYWLEAYFRGKNQETRILCSNRFSLLYASLLLSDLLASFLDLKRRFVCFIALIPELTQVHFPSKDQDLHVMNPASELRLMLCRGYVGLNILGMRRTTRSPYHGKHLLPESGCIKSSLL